jgi:hypothetical protein
MTGKSAYRKGAWDTFHSTSKDALSQAANSMRDILRTVTAKLASNERVQNCSWAWMESTHYRSGEKALLSYNVSKGPELSNPMDLNYAPTGNTCFVLDRDL